ncbi:MAG TPA: hypothetical protein VFP64_03170 [Pyrinomonadaceae bacterium]|nr:hypothetical protein [Pyrinomonadaceae bacterium]
MIHNLKALGFVLAAVLAMSAVAVSGASAAPEQGELTSANSSSVTLTGTETGVSANRLRAFGIAIECPGSEYTGHRYNETPHSLIPTGSTTATLIPKYREVNAEGKPNCNVPTLGFNWKATIDVNGCDYVLHLGKTTGVADQYAVTFDIVCSIGQEITITLWTNGAAHTAENRFCVLHVPPQVGLTGAKAKDTTNGHIDLEGTITGIKATKTGITPAHTALCEGTTHTESAQYDLDVTVSADDPCGKDEGICLSET